MVSDNVYVANVFEETSVYSAWLACANERDIFARILYERRNEWLGKDPTRLLDIGCGSGAAGLRMMDIADSEGVTLEYTGIDPYQEQLVAFRQALGERDASLRVGTLESFSSMSKWDVAMAVHSLYYVADMDRAIRKLGSFADKLILVHHGERGINTVHRAFRRYVCEGSNTISIYQDVATVLDQIGWKYELITFESLVDVSACKDPKNEVGRKLISFFLERTDLDNDEYMKISSWFHRFSTTMIHDVGIFIVESS